MYVYWTLRYRCLYLNVLLWSIYFPKRPIRSYKQSNMCVYYIGRRLIRSIQIYSISLFISPLNIIARSYSMNIDAVWFRTDGWFPYSRIFSCCLRKDSSFSQPIWCYPTDHRLWITGHTRLNNMCTVKSFVKHVKQHHVIHTNIVDQPNPCRIWNKKKVPHQTYYWIIKNAK